MNYEQSVVNAFAADYADVLALDADDFSVKDDNYYKNEARLKAAISAYESLSESDKEALATEKAKLDELSKNIYLEHTETLNFSKGDYGTWTNSYFTADTTFKTTTSALRFTELTGTLSETGLYTATDADATVANKSVYASQISDNRTGTTVSVVSVLDDIGTFKTANSAYELKSVDFGYLIPSNTNATECYYRFVIYDYTDSQNFKAFYIICDTAKSRYAMRFYTVTEGVAAWDDNKNYFSYFTTFQSPYCGSRYVNIRFEYSEDKTVIKLLNPETNTVGTTLTAPTGASTHPALGFTCRNYSNFHNYAIVDGITMNYATMDSEAAPFTMDMHKGAYIYTGDPTNLRFGVDAAKTDDTAEVIEYGMIFMPTDKVGDDGLTVGMENAKNSNGAKGLLVKKTKGDTSLTLPQKYYGLLTGIASEDAVNGKYIARAFTTRAYIKYTLPGDAEGTYRVAYSDLSYSRSVYGTALRAANTQVNDFATNYPTYVSYIPENSELDFADGVTAEQIAAAGSTALAAVWNKYSS